MSETNTALIDDRQAGATAREIAQQPSVWREVATIIEAERNRIDEFLAARLADPELRIILTGAGTSAFIGSIAAPELTRCSGRRVDAVATTDIVSNPRNYLAENVPTLLVSFARSGRSPESVAATRLADELLDEVAHLIVTCDASGDLGRQHAGRANSLVVVMPERANDEAFAMTSSFTSMLLAILLIFGSADGDAVDELGTSAARLMETRLSEVTALADAGYDRVVYLGSGPLAGLARESALKLLELTAGRIVTYHDSSLGFRHGPKAVLDDRTLAIVYLSSDATTREYDLDIAAELRRTIGERSVITISPSGEAGDPRSWALFSAPVDYSDGVLAAGYVVVAQLLALSLSLHLGLTPDNPFPDGDVNRVVQGVTIHPLAD